jgi:nucleoside-diphosphate-sugar epimerase
MTLRALVTGASGFLGRHVLAELAARGVEAIALGRSLPVNFEPRHFINLSDVGDARAIREAVKRTRPDAILHLAGTPRASGADELYRVNVLFGIHLLEAAHVLAQPPTVLLVGSAAEYGPVSAVTLPVTEDSACWPNTPYGITKLAQSLHGLAVSQTGVPVVIGRLFNPVGAGMPNYLALGSFAEQIIKMGSAGGVLVTGDIDVERDFIAASEAARVLVDLVFSTAASGHVINVCSGRPMRLRVLTEHLIRISGLPIQLQTAPGRRGITDMISQFGSPDRLRGLGITPPTLDLDRVSAELLAGRSV